ncbi:MAG: TldD/PmbA family protein [Nitrospirae bacterium]|nr:TldD/PmbA family protein [Nitrospirota bacterium]
MIDPEIGQDLLTRAKKKGATGGDIVMAESSSFSVQIRMGEIDKISQASGKKLGLRLFFGKKTSISATSDLTPQSLTSLLNDTCEMAKATEEDPFSGLPDADQLAKNIPDLRLDDPGVESLSVDQKIKMAKELEAAALSYDPKITNSEGSEVSHYRSHIWFFNSDGFKGDFPAAGSSLSVSPIAGENGQMQRDYWYSTHRKFNQLAKPAEVGIKAAQRALRRLGARKIKTCEVPVVFDPEMAGSLVGNLFSAVAGSALYRGASFLIDKLGVQIASPLVTVIDDGTIPEGLGSKPFDGEGLPVERHSIVEKGVLKNYILDTYSARKLKMKSTGNASRSIGDSPSAGPTNFFMMAGESTPGGIISSVKSGLYVTEMIGFGVNMITGDFSRGAAGIWIENGELTYPVEEVTVAGNLKEMFLNIDRVGNDLVFNGSVVAPTLRISKMTIAGN